MTYPCGLTFDIHGHLCVASAQNNNINTSPDPNRVGGVHSYDWVTMERVAQIEGNGSCRLDFSPRGRLFFAFTTDEQIGVYSLRHGTLEIIDDILLLGVSPYGHVRTSDLFTSEPVTYLLTAVDFARMSNSR